MSVSQASSEFNATIFVKDSMGPPEGDLNSLPIVALAATPETRIHDLARQAMGSTGDRPEFYSLLFVMPPDERGRRFLARFLRAAVGSDGHLYWRVGKGSNDTTIADVVRTQQAGLFKGDPLAYAVDRGGYGEGGFVATWSDLVALLTLLADVHGGAEAFRDVAVWLRDFVQQHSSKWVRRHAKKPGTFFGSILDERKWNAVQLARLLDIERDQAAKLLDAIGYDLVGDDTYRWSADRTQARLRRKLMKHGMLWVHEDVEEPEDDEDDD